MPLSSHTGGRTCTHPGVDEEGPRDGDALLLPSAQAHVPLANQRRLLISEGLDEQVRHRWKMTIGKITNPKRAESQRFEPFASPYPHRYEQGVLRLHLEPSGASWERSLARGRRGCQGPNFFLQCSPDRVVPARPTALDPRGPFRVVHAGNAGLVPGRRRPPVQPLGLWGVGQKVVPNPESPPLSGGGWI